MTSITFLSPSGATLATVQARNGESVMRAALRAGIEGIEAECGGSLTCATCHVYVREDQASLLPPPSEDELGMLDYAAAERRAGSRLSCQLVASDELGELTVQVPDTQY
jgi:ferredoxin, 2Fe-2S